MSRTTRLGWDVFTSSSNSRLTNFPWITGKVRAGDAYTVLNELARRFNAEVETIRRDWSWGWAYRDVRGASVVSEHAAGTAVDFNAPRHPLGKVGTFSSSQVRAIRRILNDLDGAVRWGGDYSGRKDEMHFELQGGVKKLAAVAKKIKGGSTSTASKSKDDGDPNRYTVRSEAWLREQLVHITDGTSKNSTPHLIGLYQIAQLRPYELVHDQIWGHATDQHYRWVHALQVELNRWKGTKIPITKTWDKATRDRVIEWQQRNMGGAYKGTIADGVVGPLSIKPLGLKPYPN